MITAARVTVNALRKALDAARAAREAAKCGWARFRAFLVILALEGRLEALVNPNNRPAVVVDAKGQTWTRETMSDASSTSA